MKDDPNEDQKVKTMDLYKKIRDLLLEEKKKVEKLDYGANIIVGALGSAIVSVISHNSKGHEDLMAHLEDLCDALREAALNKENYINSYD